MPNKPAYPGRDQLDTANALFRRNVARAYREATRHDPKLLPDLERVVREAAEHLGRLAQDAQAVHDASSRIRAALKAQEDKTRATLRKAVRRGSPQAADMLRRLDEHAARRGRPADDDA
ncbi:hypothetical protein [Streptomyces viridosporus]|uniref:hypothetical protein n=1 Tax=Streptomyces viridosporus TaxID=67581 RepID=UPI0037021A97